MGKRDSKRPIMNRATGLDITGSYSSLVTGPDGKSNSALEFLVAQTLTTTLSQVALPTTLNFWIGNMVAVGDLFNFVTPTSNFIVRIVQPGDTFLRLTNGVWTQDTQLEWTGNGWVMISVSSDGVNLYVYENGTLRGIIPVPVFLTTYGGTVTIVGMASISMFDIRRIPRMVVSDALQWYYDDIINNDGGGGLLPIMR